MDRRLERAPFGVLEVSPEGTVLAANELARDLLDADGESVAGAHVGAVFPESVAASLPAAFETGDPPAERSFEEYYPGPDRWLDVSVVPDEDGAVVYLEEVSDRRAAERTAERLRDDLDRLAITEELISDVLSELVAASGRAEIAETICDRLGSTDIYDFAWVGERDLGSDRIVVRASAGETGRTLGRIREALDDQLSIPEEGAVETGEVRVIQPLAEDRSIPEPIRRAAFADGVQSMLAIPLTYGSTVYGVVGVYASGQEAFSERERESFGTVGEMAGFAVNATRHRNLLLSDTVVELALEVRDAGDPLVGAVNDPEGEVSVQGTVLPESGGILCYLTVDGTRPAEVAAELRDSEGIAGTRVVSDGDEAGSIEAELESGTLLGELAAQGVTPREAVYGPDTGRVVAELSPEEDPRRIAEAVTRRFDAEVVAKRERERSVTTASEFRDELRDELTDRQETVLRTAFFADYFESPRGSSAEEVGDTLDITGSTLLYHLRTGQRKLLREVFDRDGDLGDHPR